MDQGVGAKAGNNAANPHGQRDRSSISSGSVFRLVLCIVASAGIAAQADPAPQPVLSAAPASPAALPQSRNAVKMMGGFSLNIAADMQRMRAQIEASGATLRAAILASLSPAQRSLVAATIGQLAIAPIPDRLAAARQIDATLSNAQRQTIDAAVLDALARNQAAFAQMTAHIQTEITPQQPQAAGSGASPRIGEMSGAVQSQIQAQQLETIRNQTAGSIIISVLDQAGSSPLAGPSSTIFGGPIPALLPVLPK